VIIKYSAANPNYLDLKWDVYGVRLKRDRIDVRRSKPKPKSRSDCMGSKMVLQSNKVKDEQPVQGEDIPIEHVISYTSPSTGRTYKTEILQYIGKINDNVQTLGSVNKV